MICPMHLKMPAAVALLPKDERGFPVPFFSPKGPGGKPVFAAADERKRRQCAVQRLCWICGQPLFDLLAFVGGPKSADNRVFSDAASHVECAVYSVQVCPWLADPAYGRRAFDHLGAPMPGQTDDKPGRVCVFVTRDYRIVKLGPGHNWLFKVDPALEIQWWKDGVKEP